MQVNMPLFCLVNKHTHTHTHTRIHLPDGKSSTRMAHQRRRCSVTVRHTHAHTHAHTRPSSRFADSTKSEKQLDLAAAALRHTDNGYGGSLKTCSGRWISYSLLLWWASSVQDQRISMRFVSEWICVGQGDISEGKFLPSNMHWHVFFFRHWHQFTGPLLRTILVFWQFLKGNKCVKREEEGG